MKESKVELVLKETVKEEGGLCLKFRPIEKGYPDRIVLFSGKAGFVECKAPHKDLLKLQKIRKEKLENLGFLVYKLDTPDKDHIKRLCHDIRHRS